MRRRRFPAASAGERRHADLFFADLMGPRSVPPAGVSQARLQADRFLADLLGEPAHALRGRAQESPEQLAEWGGPFGVALAKRHQRVTAFFDRLKKDFQAAGITFSGVDLIDMQQHAQYNKLKMFQAWTNSTTEIYVNVDGLKDLEAYVIQEVGGANPARLAELIYATILVRHELQHIDQFKKTGVPTSSNTPYKTMCEYEKQAYGNDGPWLESNRAKLKTIGMTDAAINHFKGRTAATAAQFDGFVKLSSESAIKKALTYVPTDAEAAAGDGRPFLPPHDKLADLYKAK
jgi:hypothetical protein